MRVLKNNLNIEMSMKDKTIEEKRDALISEFTSVAPFFSHGFCGNLKIYGCGEYSKKWIVSSINQYFTIEFDGNRSDFHESELDDLYSLSGLEARDAADEVSEFLYIDINQKKEEISELEATIEAANKEIERLRQYNSGETPGMRG